jgi:hypothetical protein
MFLHQDESTCLQFLTQLQIYALVVIGDGMFSTLCWLHDGKGEDVCFVLLGRIDHLMFLMLSSRIPSCLLGRLIPCRTSYVCFEGV